ncbi:MAG: hypothetical protein JXB32_14880 [Deltaproteobacteria bacterium]|nr:hypothetical protein [Deltaproteobacteria bacterium]
MPVPTPAVASLLARLSPALAQALATCLPLVLRGMQVRAGIRTAVRAVEASHELRMEALEFLDATLERHSATMSRELREAYLGAMLQLCDPRFYVLPWERLLPER